MGSVININPTKDLERFFDYMYGDETGYVYSPTKNPDPENPVFLQFFFEWPTEKEELIKHIQTKTLTTEVYYAPALYHSRLAEKDGFKGTNFLWVDFDGTNPTNVDDVPTPSLKIRSSTDKHEHWYWKLDKFIEDIAVLEDLTRRLAYHLGSDNCWNANRVLRPPGTRHHDSGETVSILKMDPQPYPINSFSQLPQISTKIIQDSDINYIPQALEVIFKYSWENRPEDIKLFMTPKIDRGHRSSALTKLGHICIELGMTNAETLSLLFNADSRWGKYSGRSDQKTRLVEIINYCRSKHPVDPITEEAEQVKPRLKVYTFEEFIKTDIKLEWVVEGLIHKKGLAMLSGPPDVGKSQMSIRFAQKLAEGKDFLKWTPERPMRTMMVSMEMPHEELHYILEQMNIETSDLLRENMLIMPLGYSIKLGNKAAQAELASVVEEFKPDGIIFDSFGVSISDDINSEKIILETLDYVHKILRGHFGAFIWFIHHNRKAQIGNKKPNKLEDLFGSQYISAALTTAIGLWPVGPTIEVSNLKLRMAKKFDPFIVKRTPGLDFELVTNENNPTKSEGSIFRL